MLPLVRPTRFGPPAVLAFLLAACVGGSGSQPAATATPAVDAPPAASPTPTPGTATPPPAVLDPTASPVVAPPTPTIATARVVADRVPVYVVPHGDYPVLGFLDSGDEVPIFSRVVSGSRDEDWIGIPGVGWIKHSLDTVDLNVDPDSLERLPLQTAPLHDASVRTGVPRVDAIIEAALSGDATSVAGLFRFTTFACVERRVGGGSPPQCPDGVAEGTPVEAFSVSYSSNVWIMRDEAAERLDRILVRGESILRLYAVIDARETSAGTDGREYFVIFGYEAGVGGSVGFWVDDSGAISHTVVGELGDSPGWKLVIMTQAQPEAIFLTKPRVPAPLTAGVP